MEVALYHDMAGPLLVIFLFGMSFIFKGRMEFGNIYGFTLCRVCHHCAHSPITGLSAPRK